MIGSSLAVVANAQRLAGHTVAPRSRSRVRASSSRSHVKEVASRVRALT
jgi:hypothetical protein